LLLEPPKAAIPATRGSEAADTSILATRAAEGGDTCYQRQRSCRY